MKMLCKVYFTESGILARVALGKPSTGIGCVCNFRHISNEEDYAVANYILIPYEVCQSLARASFANTFITAAD